MQWNTDLTSSPYKPKRSPLFLIDLALGNDTVYYSTPLESFETTLVALFNKGIEVTQNIPQLEGLVMEDLF
jgi:dynein heavy chain